MKTIQYKNWIMRTLPVLICILLALYFRTFSLHHPVSKQSSDEIARLMVYQRIKSEIKQSLDHERSDLGENEKWLLAGEKAGEIIKTQKEEFLKAVQTASQHVNAETPIGTSRHYLLESDP